MKLHGIKVEFALIDDVNKLMDSANALYDLQDYFIKAETQAKKCLALYKEAEKKTIESLNFAKQLGDSAIIGLFQKKLSEIQNSIKGTEKNLADSSAFAKRF